MAELAQQRVFCWRKTAISAIGLVLGHNLSKASFLIRMLLFELSKHFFLVIGGNWIEHLLLLLLGAKLNVLGVHSLLNVSIGELL